MLKPQPGYILATPDEGETKTKSGILLTGAKREIAMANVVSVNEVDIVQPGDKIVYSPYSSTELRHEGTDYLIINADDVMAIVNE